MKDKHFPPGFGQSHFHCPHCQVYAHQEWSWVWSSLTFGTNGSTSVPGTKISKCGHCLKCCIWESGRMVFPEATVVQPANPDLPDDVKNDYNEAASIIQKSPRGAAALLRLAIQKLCIELGGKGKKIDDDIALLVSKGLPERI